MMKNLMIFLGGLAICVIGCGQIHDRSKPERLTCLILGYDSLIYYTGSSKQMQDISKGTITDTAFVNTMFSKIKSAGLLMVLKPGGGTDMLSNFQEVVGQANSYGVINRLVDSGDANEEKEFGFVTPPMVRAAMRGEDPLPLKLDLPRDEPSGSNPLSDFLKSSQLVILISESNDIYAYMGTDIRKGNKYTYQQIKDLVKEKMSDKNFSVLIKAAKDVTYKNTVDMLDVMTIADVKHYALVDITKEEEDYLRQIHQ